VKGAGRLAWPYLAGLALLVALPALLAAGISLTEFSALQPPVFVGVANFARMLDDELFWTSLGNSAVYVAVSVPLRVAAAAGCALLLARRTRPAGALRPLVYLPTAIPEPALALLWLWVLNPLYGPLAGALRALGLGSFDALTDPWSARIALAVLAAFQIGEGFVVALAARRVIPTSLYEAAAVDGARPGQVLRRVTLPLMAPALLLLGGRDVVLGFQTSFVPALLVTEGGPRYATTYLPVYAHRQAFSYFRLGYGAALSVVMFALSAGAVYVLYRLGRRWRYG
jgi:multiple sugar transport system permease protein